MESPAGYGLGANEHVEHALDNHHNFGLGSKSARILTDHAVAPGVVSVVDLKPARLLWKHFLGYVPAVDYGWVIKGSAYTIDPAQSQVSLISNLDSFAIFQE